MAPKLDIALLQTSLTWEDSEKNLKNIESKLNLLDRSVDIIVLPEMFNTGFTMNTSSLAQKMNGPAVEWLKSQSKKLETVLCGSLIIEEDKNHFNRFIWAEKGNVKTTYDKRHLFRMAGEHNYFKSGSELGIFEFNGWRISPRICYDLRFPVWSRSTDVDLQIYVANWPSPRVSAWDKLLMARAIENQCFVAGVNRIGTDGTGKKYLGHSIVIDPKGNAQTLEKKENEGWIYSSIDLDSLNEFRRKFPLSMDADNFSITD